ncbi:tetratricopeptide repeat protein [Streptomyces jeddahensis]|uniref:Beta-barrel assembly-enhancing protease n=1 Tax=Streptomyces jeddahensis TaxID=1716141 RepID=A0A177HX24_9ACTN|nr:tetratricopeptide repeat protein [Streptomyces jeddahensis]OAH15137.1 beta-barrel assembly-enhancing protease [Streptomyces jeddahensis]
MEIEKGQQGPPSEAGRQQVPAAIQTPPGTTPPGISVTPSRGRRLPRAVKRALAVAVVGGVVAGGVLALLPWLPGQRHEAPLPAPGPGAVTRAATALGAGMPASTADLTALIDDRVAHLRTHPGDQESWAVLGTAYVEKGRQTADAAYFPKAEKALRTSLKAKPEDNVQALAGLAALAGARHDFRAAKRWGEQAVELAPKRWTSYPVLIEAYGQLGDQEAAAKTLDKLRGLGTSASSRAAGMLSAGQVYWNRGWREDAAAVLADATVLARSPAQESLGLFRSGEILWERGEPAQALRYYEAALRADRGNHAALAGKGRALAALGRTAAAVRAYKAAIAKQPTPEYALELGELYESLDDAKGALAQYDALHARVRRDDAGGVNDELILGLFEADHGDPASAVRRLQAEWGRHGSAEVADALGWALHRAGDDEEALKHAVKAMDQGQISAVFAYHRGEIERALGRYGAARRHLQQALRINPYFSPLLAPRAEAVLEELGEPAMSAPPD